MCATPSRSRDVNTASRGRGSRRHGTPGRGRAVSRQSPARNTPTSNPFRRNNQRSTLPATPRQNGNHARPSGGAAEQPESSYELPRAMLPSIFGHSDIDVNELGGVLRRLRRIQQDGHGKHRFHLIVESDNGEVLGVESGRFNHVMTRVLFSPTVSLQEMHDDFQVNLLARVLNNISWCSATSPDGTVFNSVRRRLLQHPRSGGVHSPLSRVQSPRGRAQSSPVPVTATRVAQNDEIYRSQRQALSDDAVAYWTREICDGVDFPSWFPYRGSDYKDPPQLSSESLYVDRDAVERFEFLETAQVVWIYRELFEFLHNEAKKQKIPNVPRMFKYACFTPPWFRKELIKGSENDQRNHIPVRLEVVVLPDMRKQRSRMGAKRIAYILGAFCTNEAALTRDPLRHLLRTVPMHPTLQKKRATPRKRKRPEAPAAAPQPSQQRRDTSRSEDQIRAENLRHNESNGRSHVETIEDSDVDPPIRKRLARRLDEEPIDLENVGAREVSRTPRVTRPVGPRGTTRERDTSSSEDSEDERVRRLFEDDVDQERSTLQMLESQEIDSRRRVEVEREPAGDEEDDDVSRRRTEEIRLTSDVAPTEGPFQVVCAFGGECRFRDSRDMQESSRITGRCRGQSCQAIMHDLCGGGEFGNMLCLRCSANAQA